MLSFVILFFAAIELAPVPMSVLIVLPLILCTMHSESADIALAISQIMVLMLHPMAYCAFALMECAFGYPFAPSMLSFVISPSAAFYRACMPMMGFITAPLVAKFMLLLISALALAANDYMLFFIKLFFAAIELAPVPMVSFIVLPFVLCTVHGVAADIALAGIVNILAVIHTLHIVAYLTFALMARSYAFPISPIMLGLVFGPIAAFLGACMPMVYFIIAPFIAIIMFLLVSALALAANDHMIFLIKLLGAAIELALVPMGVLIVLPLILCTMHSESADIALAGIVNILAVIHTLHIVAYLTFALMARSYAFPISPIMLGLVFGPIAAFLGACMPMVYFIIAPFIAIIMFLLVSALALAANDHMIFLIKLLGAAIELALVPMGVLIVLPLILCTMHSESADIALAGGENILTVIHALHIMAYCAFARMARSCAFPISPIMYGFAVLHIAAFALMPMVGRIVLPLGFPVMLVRLFVFAYDALAVDNDMHSKIGVPFAAFMRAGVPMVIGVIRPICFSFVLVVYLVSASRANICTVSDFLPCMCSGGFGVMHVAAFVFAHMEVLIWNCRPLIAPFMLYVAPFVAALCAYIVAVAVRRFEIVMSLYVAVVQSAYFARLVVELRQRHLVAYPLGSIGIIQMVFLITAYA